MDYDYIDLDSTWLAFSKQAGTERDSLNGGNNTPAYAHNNPLPYSSLTAARLAVVGEVAGHFYLGVDPNNTVFVVDRTEANYAALKASADLTVGGRKIEVRNCAVPTSPLPIKEKDVAANAIVIQVHVEMAEGKPTGKVYFLGWADAAKDYEKTRTKISGTAYKYLKRNMGDLSL